MTKQSHPKRIKIRRLGNAIGEAVCLIPTFRFLKQRFPDATLVFEGDEDPARLLRGIPELNESIISRQSSGWRRQIRNTRRAIEHGIAAKERDFDLVIDLQAAVHEYMQDMRHSPNLERIGIYLSAAAHQAFKAGTKAKTLPLDTVDCLPRLALDDSDRQAAREWLEAQGIKRKPVGIQLRSPDWQKTPAPDLWYHTANWIKVQGIPVVCFDRDRPVPWAYSCIGQDIRTVAAIIEQCCLMIGPDSGLLHIAAALNVPGVWLAGKTNVEILTKHYPKVQVVRKREAAEEMGCRMPCYGDDRHGRYACGATEPVRCLAMISKKDIQAAIEKADALSQSIPFPVTEPAKVEVHPKPAVTGPAVSVIIPVPNGYEFTKACLDSLRAVEDVPFEVIVVNNGITENPLRDLLKERDDIKVIRNATNVGYGPANNQAAKLARGEYLVFLNNDTVVDRRFIRHMTRTFARHPLAGAVGNRHLSTDRQTIVSAGSYWDEGSMCFAHRFKGQPAELHDARESAQLNMATGACLMVRADVFRQVGGFDEGYRYGYWEDADLCMKIRMAGWQVWYCPDSTIVHHVGGSKIWYPDHRAANRDRFRKKWLDRGKFEKVRLHNDPHVVAGMIVLNEAEYLSPCLEAVYDFCDEIIIVEGGNEFSRKAGMTNPAGASQDCTDFMIRRFLRLQDPLHKVEHITGFWPTKTEQRHEYMRFLSPGDWLFVLDADDLYTPEQLARLRREMLKGEADLITFDRYTFWGDFDTWADGTWDRYIPNTLVYWQENWRLATGCHGLVNEQGRPLTQAVTHTYIDERLCYHYAYVRPLHKIEQKIAYYAAKGNRIDPAYMETFRAYRRGELGQVRETHPFGGSSPTHRFTHTHPEPIQRRIDSGEFDWARTPARTRTEEAA